MRSLFLRVFVWFWLTIALVVTVHFLSTRMAASAEGRMPFLQGQLTVHGLTAAEKYEQGGRSAAFDYLALLERATPTRAYLFDEDGNEVAGREAPSEVTELARMVAARGKVGQGEVRRPGVAARRIDPPGGKSMIIVGEMTRPPGMPLPFWPRFWWAQLLAVLLTAGLLCYGLAKYLSSPVVKLRAATKQLAAGDLSARVGAAKRRRRDELADLGRDFDVMAERLQSLMASQRRLLHDISHELRSPLARLKIALELARPDESAEAGWALKRIESESDRLDDLIDQLLTLARLESDSSVATASLDLQRLVDEVVLDANFEAQSTHCTVKVAKSHDCVIVGNEPLLRSAIENVIRNAVAYTPEGTEVEVSLSYEKEDPRAVITVLDWGPGIPESAMTDIFRPFYRVADSRDRESGGSGLGLSISQRAVQAHGGKITAFNAAPAGLLVEIVIPCISEQHS